MWDAAAGRDRAASAHHASVGRIDGRRAGQLGGDVLLPAGEPQLGRAAARAGAVRAVPAAALARAVQRAAGRVSGRADPLARRVGGVHGRLRDQQRVPARRRQHRAAVPDPGGDPASSYPTVAAALSTGVIFDWFMGAARDVLRVHPGRVPQAARLLEAAGVRHQLLRLEHALHAVPADACSGIAVPGRVRAAVGARAGVLGAGPPGVRDPARPPTLPARDGQLAVRELDRALRLLLGAARRVPHRRLGPQRAARARRPGGRVGVPVHAGRRRRPAGAAADDLRPQPRTSPSFSVGQQIATAVLTSVLGFAALVLIFRFKSFREVIARGKAHRRAQAPGERPEDAWRELDRSA